MVCGEKVGKGEKGNASLFSSNVGCWPFAPDVRSTGSSGAPLLDRHEVASAQARVERQVEPQHVDPGHAQHPELSAIGVPRHQGAHGCYIPAARAGDAGDLVLGCGRADVRVQPALASFFCRPLERPYCIPTLERGNEKLS